MIMKEDDISNFLTANNQPGEMPLVGVSATSTKNMKNMIKAVIGANLGGAIGGAIVGANVGSGLQCILSANNNRFVIGFFGTMGSQITELMNISRNDINNIEIKNAMFGSKKIIFNLKNNTVYKFDISSKMFGQPNHKQRLSELMRYLSV